VEVRMVSVRWLHRHVEATGLPAHQALPAAIESLSNWDAEASAQRVGRIVSTNTEPNDQPSS
jgi:hypothetical protein